MLDARFSIQDSTVHNSTLQLFDDSRFTDHIPSSLSSRGLVVSLRLSTLNSQPPVTPSCLAVMNEGGSLVRRPITDHRSLLARYSF